MDEFVTGVIATALTVIIIICSFINWGLTVSNNDHNFDVACINKGKSLVYEAIQGESYAKKECK